MDIGKKLDELLVQIRNEPSNSLGLKPPEVDALPRSQELKSQNPGYESPKSARLAEKLRTGGIPKGVTQFTNKAEYLAAVKKYLDGGGATAGIRKNVGILVGLGHDGNPAFQQVQSRGQLQLRSSRETTNTALNRELNSNLSNPDPAIRQQADARMQEITRPGIAADHDHSLTRVGNALEPMTEQRRSTYRSNFEASGQRAGHYPENIKALTASENRGKENGRLVTDANGKFSGGYKRLDDNLLRPMERSSPSPTELQIKKTGTTSTRGRQTAAISAQRRLPGFPKLRGNLGMNASVLGILPDVVEVVDGYTGGRLEQGFKDGVNGLKDLFIRGIQGWQQILTPQPAAPKEPVNYGQSNPEPLVSPRQSLRPQQPKQREFIFGERRSDGKQWGGANYGWQSPESFRTIDVPMRKPQ